MQEETDSSMKSQSNGVRKSSEEGDASPARHKRIKLVHSPNEDLGVQEGVTGSLDTSSHFNNEVNGSGSHSNQEEHMQINNEDNEAFHNLVDGFMKNGDKSISPEYIKNGIDDEQDTIVDVSDHYQSDVSDHHQSDVQLENTDSCVIDRNDDMHSTDASTSVTESNIMPVNTDVEVNKPKNIQPVSFQSENYLILEAVCQNSSGYFENYVSSDVQDDSSNDTETSSRCSSPNNTSFETQGNIIHDSQNLQSSQTVEPDNLKENTVSVEGSAKEISLKFSEETNSSYNSAEGELEPVPSAPPSHSNDVESEEFKSIELSKKDDIKYLGIYNLKTTQLDGHADVILSVAAAGNLVISSSGDTTVKVWNVEEGIEIANLSGHSGAVTAVILLSGEQSKALEKKLGLPEGSTFVVTASLDCHVKVWSVHDGKEILSIYTYNSITCMDYLQSELSVVIGTDGGKLEVWDLVAAKKIESVFAHESSVSSLKVNDCYVYSSSTDGAVKVWLFDDGEELQPLYSRRRRETSSTGTDLGPTHWKALAYSNDMLFLGDTTPYLKALNWRKGRLTLFTNQLGRAGECDAVFAQNDILLSTFYNSSREIAGINVWSLPDITYVGTLTGDVQDIYCLAMAQNEDKLRIVSGGHQLIVWDFNLKEPSTKSAGDPLYVCEIEGLGTEVNEMFARSPSGSISSITPPMEKKVADKKQGSCNII